MPDLLEQQRAVVRALVGGGPPPSGFDARRLELTRLSLLRKRARGVASHWPALGAMPDFEQRFMKWAATREPEPGHDEGLAFGRSLGRELPAAARVEQLMAGQRRVARDAGALVVRLPLLGVRRWGSG